MGIKKVGDSECDVVFKDGTYPVPKTYLKHKAMTTNEVFRAQKNRTRVEVFLSGSREYKMCTLNDEGFGDNALVTFDDGTQKRIDLGDIVGEKFTHGRRRLLDRDEPTSFKKLCDLLEVHI